MAEFTNEKILPQSLEAEQAVLAAMFNDKDAILEVIPILKETDFYRHDHGVLYATMRNMNEQGVPIDLVTITAQLDKDGYVSIAVSTGEIQLGAEDLLIETKQTEGFESVSDNNIIVALDTHITPELLEEGFVREIISKLQTMRKEADFNVTDTIKVFVTESEKIAEIVKANQAVIAENVLAATVEFTAGEGYTKQWDVNGENVTFTVAKA